jgi:hypothetical protein
MYGDGLIARSDRYTSKGCAPVCRENRCEITTWMMSPALDRAQVRLTLPVGLHRLRRRPVARRVRQRRERLPEARHDLVDLLLRRRVVRRDVAI